MQTNANDTVSTRQMQERWWNEVILRILKRDSLFKQSKHLALSNNYGRGTPSKTMALWKKESENCALQQQLYSVINRTTGGKIQHPKPKYTVSTRGKLWKPIREILLYADGCIIQTVSGGSWHRSGTRRATGPSEMGVTKKQITDATLWTALQKNVRLSSSSTLRFPRRPNSLSGKVSKSKQKRRCERERKQCDEWATSQICRWKQ